MGLGPRVPVKVLPLISHLFLFSKKIIYLKCIPEAYIDHKKPYTATPIESNGSYTYK
jgi:hypothetical protein